MSEIVHDAAGVCEPGYHRGSANMGMTHCRCGAVPIPKPVDVTECPECQQKGAYEGRVLIDGRGVYTCPNSHRWQNMDEKPSTKGIPIRPR